MSHLGELILSYQDQHGTSDRQLALRIGVSATLIGRWKRGAYEELPKQRILAALADQLGVDLKTVVDAALEDTYYREGDGNDEHRAASIAARRNTKRPPRGPREQQPD